jgi:hypothetical protein
VSIAHLKYAHDIITSYNYSIYINTGSSSSSSAGIANIDKIEKSDMSIETNNTHNNNIDDWICSKCIFINGGNIDVCQVCGCKKPWKCEKCTCINDGDTDVCNSCFVKDRSYLRINIHLYVIRWQESP